AQFTIQNIVLPIKKVKEELYTMSKGILRLHKHKDRTDEVGDMLRGLEELKQGYLRTSNFANEIAKGNYDVDYKPLSKEDLLGNSLIDLKVNLVNAIKEAETRRKKDQIQNWITQGLAKFAEILRINNENITILGKTVITNLVQYMNINQGAIFVYNDDDQANPYLNLIAAYAYNREKLMQKQIKPGEGLVGASFIEKRTIFLKEIPNSYLTITSGLGQANPKNILIVPLKIEENVLGIIELASFKEFETYEIEFVEKIGESIAATLKTVRTNEETARLLSYSKQQAEAMKAQEEEMRQNMEELHATQEESKRREQELEKIVEKLQAELSLLKNQKS
ncbi:MAG: GAF domain-containing protein, partial [Bacteroidales bacterium]